MPLCHAPTADGTRCRRHFRINADLPLCATHINVRNRAIARGDNYIIPVWPEVVVLDDADDEAPETPPPPPRCQRCVAHLTRTEVANGDTFCGPCRHHRALLPEEVRCRFHLQGTRRRKECLRRRADGMDVCIHHHRLNMRTVYDNLAGRLMRTIYRERDNWTTIVNQVLEDPVEWPFESDYDRRRALQYAARVVRIPDLYNQFVLHGPRMNEDGRLDWEGWRVNNFNLLPGRPPARGDLEAFTRDPQNVHTRVVTEKTNRAVEMLLTPVLQPHATFHLLCEITTAFTPFRNATGNNIHWKRVIKDVADWNDRITCRTTGDHLYSRLLNGLWQRIQSSPHKEELIKRLWEECEDSVGMCCDGHITRLCNVLAGYDEGVGVSLSLNEQLQQRMGAIALMDVSDDIKRAMAEAVMTELNVPVANRAEWIEAF